MSVGEIDRRKWLVLLRRVFNHRHFELKVSLQLMIRDDSGGAESNFPGHSDEDLVTHQGRNFDIDQTNVEVNLREEILFFFPPFIRTKN